MIKISTHFIALITALISAVTADDFNYGYTSGNDYGPADWRKVECNNLETCVSRNDN